MMSLLIKSVLISALIISVIYILAQYINKKLIDQINILNDWVKVKEEKSEILYKSLFHIRSQIYLAFSADINGDREEHNKILNEIVEFITQLQKIKEDQDAQSGKK